MPGELRVAIFLAISAARAQDVWPSFDCAKTAIDAERVVCANQKLAGLDRKLASVYYESLQKLEKPTPLWFTAEQRAWIQSRNRCSMNTACIETAYTHRIAELQAKFRLVFSRDPVIFRCQPGGSEITATFYQTDPQTVILERGDQSVLAFSAPAASGARYEASNVVFWNKGPDAQVNWTGQELNCSTQ